MANQNESIEILLSNRTYLYELLHTVFSGVPNEELLHIISGEQTKEAFSLLSEADDDMMAKMAHFCSTQDKKLAENKEYLEDVKSEYTRLLIGPGKLVAYPWESTYNGKENLLFQESTLRVRQAYRKYGYLPEEYPKVADDHIALELHFMEKLSERVLKSFQEGNTEDVKQVLKDQKVFMKYHLLNWLPKYADAIQKSKTAILYPQFVLATDAFVKVDNELIDEILEALA